MHARLLEKCKWSYHIESKCFVAEEGYIEYNHVRYKLEEARINYCSVEHEIAIMHMFVVTDICDGENVKRHQSVTIDGSFLEKNGKGKFEALNEFTGIGNRLCKKEGNTLFVRTKIKANIKKNRIKIKYIFFEDNDKKVFARERVGNIECYHRP